MSVARATPHAGGRAWWLFALVFLACGRVEDASKDSADGGVDMGRDGGAIPELLASGIWGSAVIVVDEEAVYVMSRSAGSLWRVPKDGGPPTALASVESVGYAPALDRDYVYWSDNYNQLLRVRKRGGPLELIGTALGIDSFRSPIVATDSDVFIAEVRDPRHGQLVVFPKSVAPARELGPATPTSMAMDGARIFWTQQEPERGVFSMGKDGSGPVNLVREVDAPDLLVIDESRVYWSSSTQLLTIKKDGSDRRVLVSTGDFVSSLAVDDTHLYYVMSDGIHRVTKSGDSTKLLVAMERAFWIVVDADAIYWTVLPAEGPRKLMRLRKE